MKDWKYTAEDVQQQFDEKFFWQKEKEKDEYTKAAEKELDEKMLKGRFQTKKEKEAAEDAKKAEEKKKEKKESHKKKLELIKSKAKAKNTGQKGKLERKIFEFIVKRKNIRSKTDNSNNVISKKIAKIGGISHDDAKEIGRKIQKDLEKKYKEMTGNYSIESSDENSPWQFGYISTYDFGSDSKEEGIYIKFLAKKIVEHL